MSVVAGVLDALDASVLTAAYRIVGLALLSAVVAGAVSFFFRWRTRTQLPEGPALLIGLGAVAVYLNTRIALVQFLGTDGEVLTPTAVAINLAILAASTVTAAAGWQFGDRLGQLDELHPDLSPLVRATGRTLRIELPEDIEDIDGYDPVPAATKAELAGETYQFSRGLTVSQLGGALATRLKTDYDIAHVDVDLADDGTVEFLAVGGRATGIGPTLPPGTTATAITADPAFSASPGDTVQIWDGERRVGTAELRGAAGRTATVSARAGLIESLDPAAEYRLMTLPASERVDRLFAGMLRRADETMSTATVTEGSTLEGRTVGEVGLSVLAVESDGTVETVPSRKRPIAAGERLFLIGHPTHLRRVEAAATGAQPDELQAIEDEAVARPRGFTRRFRRSKR
jgi:hypothetical protein